MTDILVRRPDQARMKRRTPPLRRFVVAAIRQIERPGAFWLASGLIILIATALRTLTLPDRPLWLDETYSAWFASRSLVELWTEVPLYETHPPLYYTLLKGWISLFGSSEVSLRTPSTIASIATVFLVSISGRILRGGTAIDVASLLSALLLALNSGAIFFAQEARPYAMQSLTALAAILSALRLLQCLAVDGPEASRWSFLPSATALGLAGGATLWTHNTAVFITFGLWLGLAIAVLTAIPGRKVRNLAVVFCSGLLALAIWSPFLPMLLTQAGSLQRMDFWVTPKQSDLWTAWFLAAGGPRPILPICAAAILGLAVLWRSDRATAITLATVLIVPLYMVIAAGYVFRPVYIDRLFAWMAAPLIILAGIGIAVHRRGGILQATLGVAAVAFAATTSMPVTAFEDWRAVATLIREKSLPSDIVIALPNDNAFGLQYYGADFPPSYLIPGRFPYRDPDRRYSGNLAAPSVDPSDAELVRKVSKGHKRVWLVERSPWLFDANGIVRAELSRTRKGTTLYHDAVVIVSLFE